jgi:hypothetical protein
MTPPGEDEKETGRLEAFSDGVFAIAMAFGRGGRFRDQAAERVKAESPRAGRPFIPLTSFAAP